MKRLLITLSCCAVLAALGCNQNGSKTDTPAGHPDELRDTTRLDSAPVTPDTVTTDTLGDTLGDTLEKTSDTVGVR